MQKLGFSELYRILRNEYGSMTWWHGTRLEVIIGAILTQNTSWNNVERALDNLDRANALDLSKIAGMRIEMLEKLIRPSGFYRQKAERLRHILSYILENYESIENFLGKDTPGLRNELLSLKGIGNETADSILLYAASKPVFVIDAYTKRITSRVCGIGEGMTYTELQNYISDRIPKRLSLYKDFHAQLVEHAKKYCRKKPLCGECPVASNCRYAQ